MPHLNAYKGQCCNSKISHALKGFCKQKDNLKLEQNFAHAAFIFLVLSPVLGTLKFYFCHASHKRVSDFHVLFCFALTVEWLVVFCLFGVEFCYLGTFACGWMDVMVEMNEFNENTVSCQTKP